MRTKHGLKLEVRPDDEIAHDVRQALKLDNDVPDERITVKVEDGVVTLAGHVEATLQKQTAEEDSRKVKGTRKILNRIEVEGPAFGKVARPA
jgi:osmotically-inducible protein OsmY